MRNIGEKYMLDPDLEINDAYEGVNYFRIFFVIFGVKIAQHKAVCVFVALQVIIGQENLF